MTPFTLHAEQFPPTGSIAAEGVRNQLGRPRLDRLSVLVREAVQNSWDAKARGSSVVDFGVSSWIPTSEQRDLLRNTIFASIPPELPLESSLDASSLRLMAVYDRGTVGLGGPTRADVAPTQGEPSDFVDFMRNVGQPPDHEFGGGTYGFGKAAFYLASDARTILVHTRCQYRGEPESRFMAAGLGSQYTAGERDRAARYTGRHWWGRVRDEVVEPAVASEADELCMQLGLPSYDAGGRGTTIVIVQPDWEGREPRDALLSMGSTILRYFWPKFIDGPSGSATMRFHLALDGMDLPLPAVDAVPWLGGYVRAFRGLTEASEVESAVLGGRVREVVCGRPHKALGNIALVRYPASAAVADEFMDGSNTADGENPSPTTHHVALLRTPNFVVKYLAGPPSPSSHVDYAGVFRANREVDAAFAQAEPPTHDDWVPDFLGDGVEKTYVRVALRRLKEILREFSEPPQRRGSSGPELPLGALSDQLGGLVPASEGTGARPLSEDGADRSRPGRPRTIRRGRIRVDGEGRVEVVEGVPALVLQFDTEHQGTAVLEVSIDAAVVVEGSARENEPPTGAEGPRVLWWKGPAEADGGCNTFCTIPEAAGGRWSVAVSIPSDAMISVALSVSGDPAS
jgi:hypothetical protein